MSDAARYLTFQKDREDIIQEGKDYKPPQGDVQVEESSHQPVLEPVGGLYGMYIDRFNALSPTSIAR